MKKIVSFLLATIVYSGYAHADIYNPFFGEHRHQVAFGLGTGVDTGFIVPPPARFVPFTEAHIQYSIPSTMFYLPSRFSFNISHTIGFGERYGWEWQRFSIPIIYLTEDVALLHTKRWYFGAGPGMGFQMHENIRIGSKLVFTLKVFTGYRFTESFGMEIYAKHFSNGNTAPENNSYAFYGLSATYSF
ncbi:MAG: acyloxyacyl hydrolase [Alphaproteobacteria bacterium]|nr:acyloxyacyl hydrolase [Alphaproteobacteria bacterium]